MVLITTIFVGTCSKKLLYVKVIKTYMWIFTFSTQYTIELQITRVGELFDGLRKFHRLSEM